MTGKKILVVDDERHLVRIIQVKLERAGYEVITAYGGVEAMEKIKTDHPDMMILDLIMPGMDGWDVLKAIKADPATQDLMIIVLSCLARDADIFKAWAMGTNSYLTKPINTQELLVYVERIFAAAEDSSTPV